MSEMNFPKTGGRFHESLASHSTADVAKIYKAELQLFVTLLKCSGKKTVTNCIFFLF